MRLKVVLFLSAILVVAIALSMCFPLLVALIYGEDMAKIFAIIMLGLVLGLGSFAYYIHKHNDFSDINHREGMAGVALCWFFSCLAGALPFMFGVDISFANAFFETSSGFTTTGSTIFSNIEALPKSLLFWRSQIQWLGGMGIIVLSLAILPLFNMGSMQLYKAEVTGPTKDKLAPRLKDTAKLLWSVYVGITVLLFILLYFGGMSLYDAINHAFTTMATGGFSTKNASIAAFPSAYIQWVIILFMFIAGANFTLHYKVFTHGPKNYFKNTEFVVYLSLVCLVSFAVVISIWGLYPSVEETFRVAFFQVVSLITTTGFASADYELWPYFPQTLLVLVTILGASTSSTSGGIKVMRIVIVFAYVKQELLKIIHPHSVNIIKLEGHRILPQVVNSVLAFVLLYAFLAFVGTLILTATGLDLLSASTATFTALSNVGPGLGSVGPVDNFGHLTDFAKHTLSVLMIMGRLELFTVFVLFLPDFWKN